MAGGRRWFLTGTVAGIETKWLVDTGASCNVMDYKTYFQVCDRLEPLMLPTSCNLLGANGGHLRVYGEISLPLYAQGKMLKFQAVVADLDGIQGILGANFCYQHEIQFNFRSGLLQIGDDNIQLSPNNTGDTPARHPEPPDDPGPPIPAASLKPQLKSPSLRQSNKPLGEVNVKCGPWKNPTSLDYAHIVPLQGSPIPQEASFPSDEHKVVGSSPVAPCPTFPIPSENSPSHPHPAQGVPDLEASQGTSNQGAKDNSTLGDPVTIQRGGGLNGSTGERNFHRPPPEPDE